jgi:hypothetical protein
MVTGKLIAIAGERALIVGGVAGTGKEKQKEQDATAPDAG